MSCHFTVGTLVILMISGLPGKLPQDQAGAQETAIGRSASEQRTVFDIQDLLKRFDRNGDGLLDADERTAVRDFVQQSNANRTPASTSPSRWRDLVAVYDRNGDGELQPEERAEAISAIRKQVGRTAAIGTTRTELLKTLDLNGNGVLEADEKLRLRERIEELRRGSEPSQVPPATEPPALDRSSLLRYFDGNQDGVVDATERARARRLLAAGRWADSP